MYRTGKHTRKTITYNNKHMAKFELSNEVKPLDRIISRLAGECGYEVQQVFNDLLRYIIHGFSPGAPPLQDWKYKRQQNMAFLEMTWEWVGIMQRQTALSGWFDAFGELHMAYCSKSGQQYLGQFFTPASICELMVQCTRTEKGTTGKRISDPTCGSGRLLLAYHVHFPGNYLVGEDISRTCCMMTVCNMLIHGCVGEVICHDSLMPDKFTDGWKVNPTLQFSGLPSIRRISKEEYADNHTADNQIRHLLNAAKELEYLEKNLPPSLWD